MTIRGMMPGAMTMEPEVMAATRASLVGHDGRRHRYVIVAQSTYALRLGCEECDVMLADVAIESCVVGAAAIVATLIREHAWPPIRWRADPDQGEPT